MSSDMRSVLFMLFNPVRDELITGGVGGTKVRDKLKISGVLDLKINKSPRHPQVPHKDCISLSSYSYASLKMKGIEFLFHEI